MAVDELTYPLPQVNRQGPASSGVGAAPGAPAPPRTRIVNFFISINANTRTTRSYGPFRGPAIIKYVYCDPANGAGNDDAFFFPGYSQSAIEEALVAIATPVSWSTFYERMPIQGTDFPAGVRGLVHSEGWTQLTPFTYPVDGVVPLAEWFLTMTHGMVGGANGKTVRGHVVVIEGISPAALANFL